jgi:hypothetical protein
VYDLLKQQAEPFVDSPNSVLRRILGLEQISATVPLEPRGSSSKSDRRSAGKGTRSRSASRTRTRRRKGTDRAPRGTLLAESEYELPLLQALADRGGSAPAREVIDAVGEELADRLTSLDTEKLASGVVRWQNRVQFVRLRLVEQGLLAKDSPRGVWKLTDAGRRHLSAVA